ncbi:MAG: lipocalin-like domain-containing protein [Pseudomonadota bacterium]
MAFILGTQQTSLAQGFAGLGTTAEGFEKPRLGKRFAFPKDHGPHNRYRIEWWYLTANLKGKDGKRYGVQWTLFRSALRVTSAEIDADGWQSAQTWMGHMGITTQDGHFYAERFARGGIGQAGAALDVENAPFKAWIDDWALTSTAKPGTDAYSALSVTANGPTASYALNLTAQGPLVFHGSEGFSVKSPEGQASYYYSQPFYAVEGTLNLPSGPMKVTGNAWLDREWSSQPLSSGQDGWDWVSLHFQSGAKLMGFRVRQKDGNDFTSATWIEPDGQTTPYKDGALTFEPLAQTEVADRKVPTRWRLKLADRKVDVTVGAVNPKAWMGTSFSYWEGPIIIEGSHPGIGYLEMTGY